MIKKLLLAVAIIGTATYSQAQGYVDFNTYDQGAKIYNTDKVTPLSGNGYYAQIYAAEGTVTDPNSSLLTAKGTPVNFFSTSSMAGYVLTTGKTTTWDGSTIDSSVAVTTSSATTTTVTIQVRAWSADTTSTTYATASKSGASTLFQVAATGLDSAGRGQTPASLVGFTSFSLTPEPTTIALGALGLSVLLFRRRK
jgi:hypothetical protein